MFATPSALTSPALLSQRERREKDKERNRIFCFFRLPPLPLGEEGWGGEGFGAAPVVIPPPIRQTSALPCPPPCHPSLAHVPFLRPGEPCWPRGSCWRSSAASAPSR